jgi:serine-type D-Ala-D-Ala carboxypeptidase (penicillin-binding protein 5/6)
MRMLTPSRGSRTAARRFLGAAVVAAGLLAAASAAAQAPAPAAAAALGRLHARSAILVEETTGTVLYALAPDTPIPPASLTKLMTLHLALSAVESGRLDLDETLVPGPGSWARNQPPHSSLMFLGPEQRLTIRELLTGLVVVSGNDAAVAVAERVDGSVQAFVAEMNAEAMRLGLAGLHFDDPSGLSPKNVVTARQYAAFSRLFIDLHPDALGTFFAARSFTYPQPANVTGTRPQVPVTQPNRNALLGRYEGLDGLKTGFIDESGYNMAATAVRGGLRLIAVVLGVPDSGGVSGETWRSRDVAALLDWGFDRFALVKPGYEAPPATRVWKGSVRSVTAAPLTSPAVVVAKADVARVSTTVSVVRDIYAPVHAGETLGEIAVLVDGKRAAGFPLKSGVEVHRGGLVRRAADGVVLFFRRLFGMSVPA